MLELDRARPHPPGVRRPHRPAGLIPLVVVLVLLIGVGAVAAARFIAAAPASVPARPVAPAPAAPAEGGVVRGDGTVKARVPAGRYTVELLVLPARVGFNQLHVTVYAPDGNSARVRTFAARLVPPDGGAAVEPAAERVGGNHFLAPSARVTSAGDWTFTLNLKVGEVSDAGAEITPEQAISVPIVVPVS